MLSTPRYLLLSNKVRDLLQERVITNAAMATNLGVTRNYWSQILCGRRHLTTRVRRALMDAFPDVPADQLWKRIDWAPGEALNS